MDSRDFKSIIKKYEWRLFVTRPIDLLTVIANARAYGVDLKKAVGFEFEILPYLSKSGLVEYYRDNNEQLEFKKIMNSTINNFPGRILNLLNELQQYNEIFLNEIAEETNYEKFTLAELGELFSKKFLLFQKQFTPYVIPYFVGVVEEEFGFNEKNEKIKEIISLSKSLRLISLYTQFRKVVIGKILLSISEKISLKNGVIELLTPKEIIDLCNGRIEILENIESRSNDYLFVKVRNKEICVFNKEEIVEFENLLQKESTATYCQEFKGIIAYKGKYSGKAKIVYSERDFNKFYKGDVLVTIHSNPSLMPVIMKCGAIIADEGGITSHAAIVSREFKIPCVMGTKIATKVLKDGDLVEVDANNGIVKILND